MNLDGLTSAERDELDTLVGCIADGIDRALILEVDDPTVRRLALTEAATRFGLTPCWLTSEEKDALDSVITYMWSDELADYHQQDDDGQRHHILKSLQVLVRLKDRAV